MHRQSPRCKKCAMRDPVVRSRISASRRGQLSYPRTRKHREKMSLLLSGVPKPYLRGRKRAAWEIDAIKKAWTPEKREAARIRGLAFASDPEWRRRIGESVSGEKNGTWEHGRSQIPYSPGWGRVNRKMIRLRTNGCCERCGERKPLDTHHKDGSKSNHAEDNLQGLCRRCHKAAHSELRKMRKSLQ